MLLEPEGGKDPFTRRCLLWRLRRGFAEGKKGAAQAGLAPNWALLFPVGHRLTEYPPQTSSPWALPLQLNHVFSLPFWWVRFIEIPNRRILLTFWQH